ncbi:unnamed protein product, partial [Prorocentrum cordatum]
LCCHFGSRSKCVTSAGGSCTKATWTRSAFWALQLARSAQFSMGQSTCRPSQPGNLSAAPSPAQSPHDTASRMCFAASQGDDPLIAKLLSTGVSVNLSDYDRRTALHVAAAEGNLSTVQLLLSANADVAAADRWGHTPMDEAAANNLHDIMAALRTAGGDHGLTPRGGEDKASLGDRLGQGPDKRRPSNDSTASPDTPGTVAAVPVRRVSGMQLCCAAAAGNAEMLRSLIADGANVNAKDYDGRIALHVAAAYGHHGIVQDLLGLRADVRHRDHFGSTPLSSAVSQQHEEVAATLLKALQQGRAGSDDKKDPVEGMCSSALPGQVEEVCPRQANGCTMNWMIQEKEVKFGPMLSKTLKSAIHTAEWRGMKVVAKTLLNVQADDGDLTKEVLREIGILSTLRHPDLVMFLGACIYSPQPFLISEYMEGGDLDLYYSMKASQRGSPYRPHMSLFLRWSSAVARALCFLHNCSPPIVHRDLKPMNLLLTKNNDLKVTDFGISKLMRPSLGDRAPRMSGGVGTWRYMAPEVVRSEQYTDRVDIYSFALIMWFMSTGVQPFVDQFGQDPALVLEDYLKGREPRPSFAGGAGLLSGNRTTAAAVRQLVQECWHRRAAARPSAHQCTARLAEATVHSDHGSWAARAGKVVGRLR